MAGYPGPDGMTISSHPRGKDPSAPENNRHNKRRRRRKKKMKKKEETLQLSFDGGKSFTFQICVSECWTCKLAGNKSNHEMNKAKNAKTRTTTMRRRELIPTQ